MKPLSTLGWHLILLALLSDGVSAQTPSSMPFWAINFEKVRPSDDVYIVTKAGKMGVTNLAGKLITRLEYDTIYNFHESMAIVGRGHREVNQFGKVLSDFKYGYINKAGRLVVPMKYEIIESFSEGVGLEFAFPVHITFSPLLYSSVASPSCLN